MHCKLLQTSSQEDKILQSLGTLSYCDIDGRLTLSNAIIKSKEFFDQELKFRKYYVGFALFRGSINENYLVVTYILDKYIDLPRNINSSDYGTVSKELYTRDNYTYYKTTRSNNRSIMPIG